LRITERSAAAACAGLLIVRIAAFVAAEVNPRGGGRRGLPGIRNNGLDRYKGRTAWQ
jgi:hypothetical protein